MRHRQLGVGHRCVGHDRRDLDQRLDRAQRLGQGEDRRRAGHSSRLRLRPPVSWKREHGPRLAHLALDQLPLGVVRQAGVVNGADLGPMGQPLGDDRGVGAGAIHPHGQRAQAAQDEPAVEWARHRAGRVLVEVELLGHLGRSGGDQPAHGVGVAAQVLRGRMEHHVRPELERSLEVGRGERVVHDRERARGGGQACDLADVHHLEERVGGALDPDHLRCRRSWRRPARRGRAGRRRPPATP